MLGEGAPGPYAVAMFFTIGVALCAVPFNYLLMRKPLDKSEPVSMSGYSARADRGIFGESSAE
jgi:glucose uptake protein